MGPHPFLGQVLLLHPQVCKYFGIKKKPIFYCETLKLANLRLAEVGFSGKPHPPCANVWWNSASFFSTSTYHCLTHLLDCLCVVCLPMRMWAARGQGFILLTSQFPAPGVVAGMSWVPSKYLWDGCTNEWMSTYIQWLWRFLTLVKKRVVWGFLRPLWEPARSKLFP